MSNLIFIKDNDNNVGIGSNIINDIKGNINITQNLNVSGNLNVSRNVKIGSHTGFYTIYDGTNNVYHNYIEDPNALVTTHKWKLHWDSHSMRTSIGVGSSTGQIACMVNDNEVLTVKGTGVGISVTSPDYPLHVGPSTVEPTTSNSIYAYYDGSTDYYFGEHQSGYDFATNSGHAGHRVSAKFDNNIWVAGNFVILSSDSRIKKNITDVPDNLALEQLRNIPCKYYEYIDKFKKGVDKTIGFIAQEVKSVLPMAVTQQKQIIPNIYKVINCTWTSVDDKFIMNSSDLSNVSDVKYKFYVSNASDYSDEKEIILTGNSDNTFTFTTQYTHVFCYGNEVNDFHTLDKNKLFTVNFSASQELDRIQQTHITEIASLKAENTELKTKLNELTNKIKNATTFEDLKNSL